MGLSRRTYYYKPKDKSLDDPLIARMEGICLEFPRYGYRRVTQQLKREGRSINHKKVARIMRERGWLYRPRKKKWARTTDSNHDFQIYPNLIKDRVVDGINQVWVADIASISWHISSISLSSWMFIHEKPLGI